MFTILVLGATYPNPDELDDQQGWFRDVVIKDDINRGNIYARNFRRRYIDPRMLAYFRRSKKMLPRQRVRPHRLTHMLRI